MKCLIVILVFHAVFLSSTKARSVPEAHPKTNDCYQNLGTDERVKILGVGMGEILRREARSLGQFENAAAKRMKEDGL